MKKQQEPISLGTWVELPELKTWGKVIEHLSRDRSRLLLRWGGIIILPRKSIHIPKEKENHEEKEETSLPNV